MHKNSWDDKDFAKKTVDRVIPQRPSYTAGVAVYIELSIRTVSARPSQLTIHIRTSELEDDTTIRL